MQVIRTKPVFRDARGEITDIHEGEKFDCLTLLTSRKGAVRGDHYHKATTQYTYILSGRFRLYTQVPRGKVRTRIVKAGDLVISPPLERHAFEALENAKLLAFCTGPRAGKQYEIDTFKLEKPISGGVRSKPARKKPQ